MYRPAVNEDTVLRSMVSDLTDRLFDGKASDLVSPLISAHEIDADELSQLRELIDAAGPRCA